MKGCPEGSEQSFLFGLYSQLSSPACRCPQDCGTTIPRSKGDLLAIHVRPCSPLFTCSNFCSLTFYPTSLASNQLWSKSVHGVIPKFAWRAVNPSPLTRRNLRPHEKILYSTAPICRESFSESDWRCLSKYLPPRIKRQQIVQIVQTVPPSAERPTAMLMTKQVLTLVSLQARRRREAPDTMARLLKTWVLKFYYTLLDPNMISRLQVNRKLLQPRRQRTNDLANYFRRFALTFQT